MKNKGRVQDRDSKNLYIIVEIVIVISMMILISYNAYSFYQSSFSSLMVVGENSLASETEQVSAYLNKAIDTLEVTGVSVDSMIDSAGVKTADLIQKMLHAATVRFQTEFDKNFTGVYGYISGNYLDGTDWIPPEGYDPTSREWYVYAKEGQGKTVIVPPYVDAQTGHVLISVSKLLSDGESVISLDVELDEIQEITQDINLNGMGYGLIVSKSGLIVAHSNQEMVGKYLEEEATIQDIAREITQNGRGFFSANENGEKVTVFYDSIAGDYYTIMVINNSLLYHDLWLVVLRNTSVCVLVFSIVVIFIAFAFRKIMESIERARESRENAENMYLTIVRTLAQSIDAKDKYTNGHSLRVGKYAKEIAARLGKSEQEQRDIYYAALLHDVGKIRVPDSIINKPGKLDEEEFDYMKLHTVTGYHILKFVKENPLIARSAKEHHEHYDGKGYPNGLRGESISEIGRLVAVADAYDAMTSNRSYRNLMSQERVREQIQKGSGTQFDPKMAAIMLQMMDEDTNYEMCEHFKQQRNILLVDDDSLQHEMLDFLIKDIPYYHIHKAMSGMEALEIVKKKEIDVILLDIFMPQMDGFETYTKLREITNVPIAFLTGDSEKESIQKAYDMGVTDYLVKPFAQYAIVEVLQSLLTEGLE